MSQPMHLRHEKPLFPENARVSIAHLALPVRASHGFTRLLTVLAFAITLGCSSENSWHMEEVTGHLPDLDFSLTSDRGSRVTANEFEGNLLLLYFGYTHCNAECPVSLARLARVVQMLGDGKNQARILFVSLDPGRDTPE
ncbi:MAG TPA: SCO family protein, partial [Nitrosospira sp.]|nr:SCO family protein [Nitrosospira sp.]